MSTPRDDNRAARAVGEAHSEAADAQAQALDARAAAMLPAELLQGGEVIILLLKPSPWAIVLESLKSIVVIVLLATAAIWLHNQTTLLPITVRDLVLLAALAVGLRLFWQFLDWLSRVYVLTDRRIIRVRGVLRIQVFESSLKKIQHTELSFSVRERLLGLGTVGFATAGTAFIEAAWRMIARPLEVHQIVVQTLRKYGGH